MPMELNGAKISRAEAELDGRPHVAILLELSNACIALISEGRLRMGTLAIAIPPSKAPPTASTSAVVMGEKLAFLARLLAERLAALTGKIALLSLWAEGTEAEVSGRAVEMLKKLVEGASHEP